MAGSGKFVSRKISCVRWQPVVDTSTQSPSLMVTGSWDDQNNKVSVYRCEDDGVKEVASIDHQGDVTSLAWLASDLVMASSSTGGLVMYKLAGGGHQISVSQTWPLLHRSGLGGCTAVCCYGDNVATAGQDGKINVLGGGGTKPRSPVKVYEKGDSCSISSLVFTRATELVSANMRGQIKSWDLRSNSQEPVSTSGHTTGVSCLSRHPTQSHILVSGGTDGVMAVWDLRRATHPATLLSAHQAPLSEVIFHPTQPDHLFTCSQGGDVCHWNGASIRRQSGLQLDMSVLDNLNSSPWLSSEAVKHKVETHSLVTKQSLPVNSLDVVGHSVVFGGDNEAFYVLHNVIF